MGGRVAALAAWVRDHRGVVLALVAAVGVLTLWRLAEPTYSDLRTAPAGTCFAESPTAASANQAGAVHVVAGTTQSQTVDCAKEHLWETAAIPVLPDPPRTPYSFDAVAAAAESACGDAFAAYVGRPLDGSTLSVTARHPTKAEWDGGERRVACLLVDPVGRAVTGSLRGANR